MIATATTGDWIGRPSIINDGSKWIMVYRAGASHAYDESARVHIRFSSNEGLNWTAENKFTNGDDVTGAPFAGDSPQDVDTPCLVKAPNGDLLLLCAEKEAVFTQSLASQWRSTDGGATWTDEGVVANEVMAMDFIVKGTTIYGAAYADDPTRPGGGAKTTLWKTTDNGGDWTKVGDVTIWEDDAVNVDEASLVNPSGNTLVVMMRSRGAVVRTYTRTSTDLGATWGSVSDITSQIGIIQRPRLRIFADEPTRIYMIGRLTDADSTPQRTVLSWSDNVGVTWIEPIELETALQLDCGYADLIKQDDGDLYTVSYRGTTAAATIYEYILDVL